MKSEIINWESAGPSVAASATAISIAGIIILIFFLGVLIAIGVAQGLVCAKVKNPLAGLVIPFISFIIGLIPPFIIVHFTLITRAFLLCQIPTIVYLIIFAVVRLSVHGKTTPNASKKEIEKMNIQDL